MNPKKSVLLFEELGVGSSVDMTLLGPSWELGVLPNSTKPSLSAGIDIFFVGIRTTPRFWSSRRSTIPFFFLPNNMLYLGVVSIKVFWVGFWVI